MQFADVAYAFKTQTAILRKGIKTMGIVVIGAVFVDIKGYPLSTYIPGGRNAGRMEQVHGGVSRMGSKIYSDEYRGYFKLPENKK